MSESSDDLNTERTVHRWLPEIPHVPLGRRYEVASEPIGQGGFGVVYRARKLHLPQWVAVKRLVSRGKDAPSLAKQRQFVREVTLAASLNHPHIVRIEDWGRDAEGLYVVMALIEGGSLKQQVDNHGAVPLPQLLRYARQICLGLQAAHRQGIIHRDLKPANILLDKSGSVLLADFGLARSSSEIRDALISSSGVPMFTYAYASPEQMAGESPDGRTDLFSLGATLYHLARGTPAYDRDFDFEEIPKELRTLLSGLLKKKRDQRPATVDEVLEQLNQLQKNRVAALVDIPDKQRRQSDVSIETAETDKGTARRPTRHATGWRKRLTLAVVLACVCWGAAVMRDQGRKPDRYQQTDSQEVTQKQPRKAAPDPSQSPPPNQSPPAIAAAPPQKTADSPPPDPTPPPPAKRPELLQAPFTPTAASAAQVAWASYLKREVQWQDQFGQELRLIPPGEFQMGSDETVEQLEAAGFVLPDVVVTPADDGYDEWIGYESPRHRVRITQPFYLGVSSVTRGQFAAFVRATGYRTEAETDGKGGWGYVAATKWNIQKPEFTWKNTGFEQTDDHPVVNVTWNDVKAYVKWLNESLAKAGTSGRYRLPREAEYEYASRAGTTTRFFTGDTIESLRGFANVRDKSSEKAYPGLGETSTVFPFDDGSPFTSPAGRYSSNPFGLSDMLGNVAVWCEDSFESEYYKVSPSDDPECTTSGSFRVLRGGSWSVEPIYLRSSNRRCNAPGVRYHFIGCRVVLGCG
jgi:sulfatase modifying factor 1